MAELRGICRQLLAVAGVWSCSTLCSCSASAGLVESPEAAAELRALGQFWLLGPVLYAVAFVVGFVSVPLSIALYVLLILYFGVSGTWLTRKLSAWRRRPSGGARREMQDRGR